MKLNPSNTTPEAHLLEQGAPSVDELRARYTNANASWMFLQRPEESGQVGLFAFSPIERLLELLAVDDNDAAYDLFRAITPYKDITKPQFKLVRLGQTQEFPLTFLEEVDVNLAVRVYQMTRVVDLSA